VRSPHSWLATTPLPGRQHLRHDASVSLVLEHRHPVTTRPTKTSASSARRKNLITRTQNIVI
jgi:hypothetical protein